MRRERKRLSVDAVKGYPGNARRGNVDLIAESLRVNGQYRDVIVQESTGYVLAGNHTWQAAQQLGWQHIDCDVIDVDDEHARRIVLVDNKSNDAADYDVEALTDLLSEMERFEGTGWNADDLSRMLDDLGGGFGAGRDPDDAPEVPADPVTEPGDLIVLGEHRLLCGDATVESDMTLLLQDDPVALLFTDPPYNLAWDGGRSGKHLKHSKRPQKGIANDDLPQEDFEALIRDSLTLATSYMVPGASAYCWTDYRVYGVVSQIFARVFNHRATIVWDKTHFGLGAYYRTQYELMAFGWLGEKPLTWNAGRDERDVWQAQRANVRDYKHVTQKPVELADRALRNSSNRSDVVLDSFAGSGTTLISCEALDRVCRCMEIDPGYCDVIVQRWEKLTGRKAVRPEREAA